MRNQVAGILLALSLVCQPPVGGQTGGADADLATGIRQVDEGDLETAVITLDGVVQRLKQQKGRENDLATAHLYLAMTHLGLSQWERAKGEMREAWRNNQQLTLDPKKFPPRVIQLYEQTKQENPQAEAKAPKAAPKPTPAATAAQAVPAKKGGGKILPILIGVGVAAGGGVALAARGGGAPTLAPTPVATPAPLPPGITLLTTSPPSGSTIRLGLPAGPGSCSGCVPITISFRVVSPRTLSNARLAVTFMSPPNHCLDNEGISGLLDVRAGQSLDVTVANFNNRCTPEFTTTDAYVILYDGYSSVGLVGSIFPISYTIKW